MKDRNIRLEARAERVKTFGLENTADFAPGGKAQGHFTNITTLLGQLGQAKAGQQPARVGKSTLFDHLHLDLLNISRTAQQIGKNDSTFAFSTYLLPANTSDTAEFNHAEAVLKLLEEQPADDAPTKAAKATLRARFIAYELPADFVAHLRADHDAIANADQHNEAENLDGVENTALIDQLLGKIGNEVAELDTLMHNKYNGQPAKLAAWISASHVERAPRHKQETPVPPTPPAK
jgi:hypothetical protein